MVDGKRIPDDKDKELYYELQALGKDLALVVNKIDNDKEKERLWSFYEFGINEENLFGISVSHNRGTKNLFDWLYEKLPFKDGYVPPVEVNDNEDEDEFEDDFDDEEYNDDSYNEIENEEEVQEDDNHIKVAIIGKVNVGKSSILNALIGEERSVVS